MTPTPCAFVPARLWSCAPLLVRYSTPLLLALLIASYAAGAGGLALRRHWNLESQALDMGYADQITWNTLHGRWFRFTVFRGEVGSELGRALAYGPTADRDALFAYHVELVYLPLSALYLIYPGPETLIVALTAVLALGALPAYWIARRELAHRGAALSIAAMYLLFPSIQAANLADFHLVSMSGSLLLFALHFLLARRLHAFGVMAILGVAVKEEVGLLVGMMGLYAWIALGRKRFGLTVAGLSFTWVALCFGIIIPHFTGGAPSLFAVRYADAIDILRTFPAQLLAGKPAFPLPIYTATHVFHMLASTGYLALLAPLQLALAAPALAINGLSVSTWQHGGGAHYSSEAVPGIIVAAVWGIRRLADHGWRRLKLPPAATIPALALAGLALALIPSQRHGILPPARRFVWPAPSPHAARLRPLLARIPPEAAVSAQSNVYPHLSTRERIYVFPTIEDAAYVLLDVEGTSSPLPPERLFSAATALLTNPSFVLLAADDGFLLFQKVPQAPTPPAPTPPAPTPPAPTSSAQTPLPSSLPATFYSFARMPDVAHAPEAHRDRRITPVRAAFGDLLEIVGYQLMLAPEVNFPERHVTPVLYFRARRSMDRTYQLTVGLAGRDNVVRTIHQASATQLWYPTYRWQVAQPGAQPGSGEVIRVRFPSLSYASGSRLAAGVQTDTGSQAPWLRVSETSLPILHNGRVVQLTALP